MTSARLAVPSRPFPISAATNVGTRLVMDEREHSRGVEHGHSVAAAKRRSASSLQPGISISGPSNLGTAALQQRLPGVQVRADGPSDAGATRRREQDSAPAARQRG
jgi:hypothetical protein